MHYSFCPDVHHFKKVSGDAPPRCKPVLSFTGQLVDGDVIYDLSDYDFFQDFAQDTSEADGSVVLCTRCIARRNLQPRKTH